ncbi:MAG: acetyl-CoA carboxylase biotin carboxyl carrier protein [Candidatus Zixiibacteriota bacterium]
MFDKMIRKLVKLVEESDIAQLEFSSWGRKIKITKRYDSNGYRQHGATPTEIYLPEHNPAPSAQAVPIVHAPKETASETSANSDDKYIAIKSPMVGTFYTSPEPTAPHYVEVGQVISTGQVVCIVEAMKLMNEIESEVEGKIVKRLVENAQPIEFGQTLFLVEPLG